MDACIVYKELNDHHFAIATFSSIAKAKKFATDYYPGDTTILIQPVPFDPTLEVHFTNNIHPWSIK